MKILLEQVKTSPLFSVGNQLRVTLRSAKDQFEEVNRKVDIFHHFLSWKSAERGFYESSNEQSKDFD